MKRKLIRQGGGGTTLYLPKRWVDARGLKPGDEVVVEEQEGRLFIGTEQKAKGRSKEVDITGLDRTSFFKTFTALYESGFDEIRFTFTNNASKDFMTGKKVLLSDMVVANTSRFHGLAIVSQGDNYFQIRDISMQSEKDFDVVLRRIYYLIIEFDTYVRDTTHAGQRLQGDERYQNIIRFVSFCLRLLNKNPQPEKYALYSVINSLKDIALYYKLLSEDLSRHRLTEKGGNVVIEIGEVIRLFHKFSYKVDHEKLIEINRRISSIENELAEYDITRKEFMILYRFSTILDVVDSNLKHLIALKAMQQS